MGAQKKKTDFGREIIEDMMDDIDHEKLSELVELMQLDDKEDALMLGFEYNDRQPSDVVPQCVLDEQFGNGYICAIRHMQEIITKLVK